MTRALGTIELHGSNSRPVLAIRSVTRSAPTPRSVWALRSVRIQGPADLWLHAACHGFDHSPPPGREPSRTWCASRPLATWDRLLAAGLGGRLYGGLAPVLIAAVTGGRLVPGPRQAPGRGPGPDSRRRGPRSSSAAPGLACHPRAPRTVATRLEHRRGRRAGFMLRQVLRACGRRSCPTAPGSLALSWPAYPGLRGSPSRPAHHHGSAVEPGPARRRFRRAGAQVEGSPPPERGLRVLRRSRHIKLRWLHNRCEIADLVKAVTPAAARREGRTGGAAVRAGRLRRRDQTPVVVPAAVPVPQLVRPTTS